MSSRTATSQRIPKPWKHSKLGDATTPATRIDGGIVLGFDPSRRKRLLGITEVRLLFALAFLLLAVAPLSAMRIHGLLWRRMRPSGDTSCGGIGEAVLMAALARAAPCDPELVPDQPATAAVQDQGPPGTARSVISAPTRREPLDAAPLWADPRADRATRVAPDLIERTAHGESETRSRLDPGGGVSELGKWQLGGCGARSAT